MEKINILSVPSDLAGVGHFRNIWPAQQINKDFPGEFNIEINNAPNTTNLEYLSGFDIIHFHRHLGNYEQMGALFTELKKMGIILIMDIDDYWNPPTTHPLHAIAVKEKMTEKITGALKLADYVTTTTDIFANEIKKINPNVFVLPNSIDPEHRMWKQEPSKSSDRVRVSWIGGSCYDNKTEVLTDDGFKLFKELTGEEKIACLNPETNELEYHKAIKHIKEPYKGKLLCGENQLINYAVTPNHNMYTIYGTESLTQKEFKMRLIQAKDTVGMDLFFIGSKGVENKEITLFPKENQFEIDYDDFVYCVNVPHNIIYVRRNGKTMWCGNSHYSDLELLRPSMNILHNDSNLKNEYQIIMCGFDTRGSMTEIMPDGTQKTRKIQTHETIWNKFEEIFTDNHSCVGEEYKKWLKKYKNEPYPFGDINNETYIRRWTLPLTQYGKHYNSCDVCLAPLVENIFNEVKSELKIIEAGMMGKVLIAQDYSVYKQLLTHGENALLVPTKNNMRGWYENIKKVIKSKELREKLSTNLYNMVKDKYHIKNATKERVQFYRDILKKQESKQSNP
jgi:glycosyltransferase involved in cell wall biosynthesis